MSKRDGFSNQEIADELGISIKTVKNQMTKALSRLREALSQGHRPFFFAISLKIFVHRIGLLSKRCVI